MERATNSHRQLGNEKLIMPIYHNDSATLSKK
jgi:hypothetical protein